MKFSNQPPIPPQGMLSFGFSNALDAEELVRIVFPGKQWLTSARLTCRQKIQHDGLKPNTPQPNFICPKKQNKEIGEWWLKQERIFISSKWRNGTSEHQMQGKNVVCILRFMGINAESFTTPMHLKKTVTFSAKPTYNNPYAPCSNPQTFSEPTLQMSHPPQL